MAVITIAGSVYILNDDEDIQYSCTNDLTKSIFFPSANGAVFESTTNNERWTAWV